MIIDGASVYYHLALRCRLSKAKRRGEALLFCVSDSPRFADNGNFNLTRVGHFVLNLT